MKITAYCFIKDVVFEPLVDSFSVKDGTVWIANDYEPNTGQAPQKVRGSSLSYEKTVEVEEFLRPEGPPNDEHFKKGIEILNKYRGELNEVAVLIEGIVSISAKRPFPAFEMDHVNIRLSAENEEDERLIAEEKVIHTFGDVGRFRDTHIQKVEGFDKILSYVQKGESRLSALSIYNLGARAEERFEMEIAFASFFRIIEGYLGDGTTAVDAALRKNALRLIELLSPNETMLSNLKKILSELKLPSKSQSISDNENIVSDFVNLRHKLMHYNLKNQDRYFYSSMRVDLKVLIPHMHRAAFILIREDMDGKDKIETETVS